MLKPLAFLCIFLVDTLATMNILKVNKCPTSVKEWRRKSRELKCPEEDGYFYHCILDDEGTLVESCLPKKRIPAGSGGCPSVSIHGDKVFHEASRTDCPPHNIFCPMSLLEYYTDQLYRYPICFRRVLERANYGGEVCDQRQSVNTEAVLSQHQVQQFGNSVGGVHARTGSFLEFKLWTFVLVLIRLRS